MLKSYIKHQIKFMEKAKQLVIYYIFKFRDKQEMKLQK
jgi:hypothetical protein